MRQNLILVLIITGAIVGGSCTRDPLRICRNRGAQGLLQKGCVDGHRPIVFIHGFLGAGDNYANMVQSFMSNGYCASSLYVFDWNSLLGFTGQVSLDSPALKKALPELSATIDCAIAASGSAQVDLIGHSMGGALGYQYLSTPGNAPKVNHYIQAASFPFSFPSGVKIMSLSSFSDTIAGPITITGADNEYIPNADHLEVITRAESFTLAYTFFNDGTPPATGSIVPEYESALSGRVLTLGENQAVSGASVEVFAVNAANGMKIASSPDGKFISDSNGLWGPFRAKSNVFYEFQVTAPDGKILHYYRQPFLHSQGTVYLRTIGGLSGTLGLLFNTFFQYSDNYSALVLFSSNHGVYAGRDTASVYDEGIDAQAVPLSTTTLASPANTTIAYFLFDENGNGQSDLTSNIPAFDLRFLMDLDYFVPPAPLHSVIFTLNGKRLAVPSWKSDSEGVGIAVFDY